MIFVLTQLLTGATGDAQSNSDSHDGHRESFSHSHHRYNRSSYEHKRSRSQRNGDRYHRSTKTETSFSDSTMSHYQRLNIQPNADLNSIKTAYYSLSKIYHPDIADPNDGTAVENFRLITESYNILSDPKLKSEYDAQFNTDPVTSYTSEIFNQGNMDTNRTYEDIYRVRDADMLFRSKQEAAMEREKRMNPKKYRAGSFKETQFEPTNNTDEEIDRLRRRIDNLTSSILASNHSRTDDNFYRTHLYAAIHRRHSGLMNARKLDRHGETSMDSAIVGLLASLGIVALIGLTLFNIVVSYDIGAYLDSKLSFVQTEPKEQDSDEESSVDVI